MRGYPSHRVNDGLSAFIRISEEHLPLSISLVPTIALNLVRGGERISDRQSDVLSLAERVRWFAGGPGAAAEGVGAGEREAEAAGVGAERGEAGA